MQSALEKNCHEFLSNPVGGEIFHDQKSGRAYILSYVGDKNSDADDWANVISVDLGKKVGSALAALQLNRASSIIGHQQPVSFLSIFTFSDDPFACNVGLGSGVSFSLKEKPVLKRSYPQQEYEMIRSDDGIDLIDRKDHMLRELDFVTMQRKPSKKIPPHDRALFWRKSDLRLFALQLAPKKELYKWNVAHGKKESAVRLRSQQEVLQDGQFFAFVERVEKENSLGMQLVPLWSGGKLPATTKYKLPSDFPVDKAAMTWDASKRRLLVWGNFPLRSRHWNKAFLFNAESEQPVATFDVPKNQYVSSAKLIDGEPLLLLKNGETHNLSALMIRDKKAKKFVPIHLLLKERPGEKLNLKEDSATSPASQKVEGK